MTFQFHALDQDQFAYLSGLSREELDARNIELHEVTAKPGFPCRVSLADAEVGERVFLVNHEHQPNDTPYRASHAIYVRERAETAELPPGEIPVSVSSRLLSVRAFDQNHRIIDAAVVQGTELSDEINRLFGDTSVSYIHCHYAGRGCYAAEVRRA